MSVLEECLPSSEMWRCVDLVSIDPSEKPIASIFTVQKSANEEPASAGGCRLNRAGSSFANFPTLKMKAIGSSETSVHTRSTQRHIQENGILHNHRCENLKSYKFIGPLYNCYNISQITIFDWTLSTSDHITLIHYSLSLSLLYCILSSSVSQSYITTDGQSASLSWYQALIWGL
jgi:hypothetical protein